MEKVKLRYLDGLRGIAAFVVLIHHYAAAFLPLAVNGVGASRGMGEWTIYHTPLQIIVAGQLMVSIFFVLSAIVLSSKFWRTRDDNVVIAGAGKRYFRLAIPAIGSIVIAYILLKLGQYRTVEAASITGSGWWGGLWNFPANLHDATYQAFYGVFITGINTYNKVLWTMQIEFIGSFLVFAFLLLFGKMRYRWIVYPILAVVFRHDFYLAFVLGLALGDAYHNLDAIRGKVVRFWAWLPLLIGGLIIGSYPIASTDGTIFEHLRFNSFTPDQQTGFMHIIAAFCIVAAVLVSAPLQRALSSRIAQFLGKISFSFYLLHQTVMATYANYFFINMIHAGVGFRPAVVISFVPTAILAVIVAYLYTKYVDEPAIKISGKIQKFLWRKGDKEPAGTTEPEKVSAKEPKLPNVSPAPSLSTVE